MTNYLKSIFLIFYLGILMFPPKSQAQLRVDDQYFYTIVYENNQLVDTIRYIITDRNELIAFNEKIHHSFFIYNNYGRPYSYGVNVLVVDQSRELQSIGYYSFSLPRQFNHESIRLTFEKGFLVIYYSTDPDLEVRRYEEKIDLFELNEETFKRGFKRFLQALIEQAVKELEEN